MLKDNVNCIDWLQRAILWNRVQSKSMVWGGGSCEWDKWSCPRKAWMRPWKPYLNLVSTKLFLCKNALQSQQCMCQQWDNVLPQNISSRPPRSTRVVFVNTDKHHLRNVTISTFRCQVLRQKFTTIWWKHFLQGLIITTSASAKSKTRFIVDVMAIRSSLCCMCMSMCVCVSHSVCLSVIMCSCMIMCVSFSVSVCGDTKYLNTHWESSRPVFAFHRFSKFVLTALL